MKRCARCGNENADEMRFCLECGTLLPDAPIVIDLNGGDVRKQTPPADDPHRSVDTQIARPFSPPDYRAAANRPRRGNTKIFLAAGGVVALLALLLTGVAAIVVYNLMSDRTSVDVEPTPTPEARRTVEKDASPTPEATPTPEASRTPRKPTIKEEDDPNVAVRFDGIDVDYNVRDGGRTGMRMNVNFSVSGMKGRDSYLAIHFQRRDGSPLAARPGEYRDASGNLAAFRALRPDYDDTDYKNLELFLPYDEFDLAPGRHELKMDIDLLDGKGVAIEHLAYEDFWYEQK